MPAHIRIYVFVFAYSGFAGLIYESIWSHYLKLLLGHAAYAQTLVLAIFMGGMAIGAWLAARLAVRWRDLLLAYVVVEVILGLLALGFHPAFTRLADWLQLGLMPGLESAAAVNAAKWTASAALILPQTILLGMTFPLMTAGVLRVFPHTPGHSIASLYFANSLGAALGVLASGFWLIDAVGLPGTIMTAGLVNFGVALVVWLLNRRHRPVAGPAPPAAGAGAPLRPVYAGMLVVAGITGAASFIYEIAWIRMLSMVLGAATHSFELMLSAFILGLALGGWWIRKRIDRLASAPGFLGKVQIAMGCFALASLALYGQCFEVMSWLLSALQRTGSGYFLFLASSHALALAIMLPTTFCAGMTLPLITYILLQRGIGEQSIGTVYAANTLGAIIGVLFAVHVGLPRLGMENTMLAGAGLDIALGIAILASAVPAVRGAAAGGWAAAGLAVALAAAVLVELDPYRMASGVYRYGRATLPRDNAMLFHKDGKTATINLARTPGGRVSIMTNGKPDAAIGMGEDAAVGPDESTMVLAAAIPLALRPEARTVANIGMGSGLTTSTLLASPRPRRVDTVEIERAMFEAANGFRPRVSRAYEDPRSHFHVEDAKTFFGARQQRYDIIVSEPSNPWVSGVASLFSSEFYDRIKHFLAEDGVLVQWLQLYEIDMRLVASVINALGEHFPSYSVYFTDNVNVLFVASRGDTETLGGHVFEAPALARELAHVGVRDLADLRSRRITDARLLEPIVASFNAPANSDFFPYLERRAARTRFLGRDARELIALAYAPLPILDMLDPGHRQPRAALSPAEHNPVAGHQATARAMLAYLRGQAVAAQALPASARASLQVVGRPARPDCDPVQSAAWDQAAFRLATASLAHLPAAEAEAFTAALEGHACLRAPRLRQWLDLYRAVAARDGQAMAAGARAMLEHRHEQLGDERFGYLVAAGMLGALGESRPAAALALWETFGARRWQVQGVNFYLRSLIALAVHGRQQRPGGG